MQIKNRKLKVNNKGITLIALVITIIVLLILAGVAIATLTGDNGILTKAASSKEKTTEAEARELVQLEAIGSIDERTGKFNKDNFKTNVKKNLGLTDSSIKENGNKITVTYKGYDVTVDATTGKVTTVVKTGETPPTGDYNTGTTVAEAIEQDKPYEENTTITDDFGNKVKVPAGFKIAEDSATAVTGGVVIEDATYEGTLGSEFVWIPVGEIKTSETEIVTINLSRYTFDSEGNETDQGSNIIDGYYAEDTQSNHNSEYKNAIATDIEDFKLKASAERSGGYYIGRYEARVENSVLDETQITQSGNYGYYNGSDTMWTGYSEGQLVTKPDSQVWNYVTQNKAAELSKDMYKDKTFTSDLMNSYAWDTATLFLQTFDDRILEGKKVYSRQNSLNTDNVANQGTNNLATANQDNICNIWDMASNCYEWTTETFSDTDYPCVGSGGNYYRSGNCTATRDGYFTTDASSFGTFRPLLYL